MRLTPKHITYLKVVIHAVSLGFFTLLVLGVFNGSLGADPTEGISHFTGKAALNTLIITLLVSPIAKRFKQSALMRVRRVIGLYSFFWAGLHLASYALLDLSLNWSLLGSEIISRPYLAVGAVSWVILFLLTLTSNQYMQRYLGKRWQTLHNYVYVAVILSPIHYYWSVKSGLLEPAIYIVISFFLLALRWQTFKRWLPMHWFTLKTTSTN
ncbi:sulfoxide reductase heme-binding subunit YedZ [Photobacterium jeanii]|uniref:Protein-methionine-sulfoxide reductase heme-binding subunit MsrQ n=1 Tax=Photobacterium jeanii TaxID=858640 RepID=A0A178K2C0_9GAMM|nr:protein-methionine-sulfoxide reductase heme-binding subunit MsrQ [Photobacterium jeanii]OAN11431.1 sulfoxide reductase heme-binding subunit YedZ [Photobacterium jeanii]PST90951.1 protein-methionine-sulfoxide reductase heme-binding subunit MsrQ [Photobacterium jeanii]